MVECVPNLSLIFGSLSDEVRRDILLRVSETKLSVGQIARAYTISLAAVAKHISVLEQASLVKKERKGKEQLVSAVPQTVEVASEYLSHYARLWKGRFEAIDAMLQEEP